MNSPSLVRSELILGGQRSGKSRRADRLAQGWLAQSPAHRAVLTA
ncbi:MAG: adenosylcobinamide-phosphate guanylyltransferase, partial [Polaromonas sp.]|nr:adenosylcobinamide-phosphate guanylyltransferase [Polaromonas sp.]